MDSHIMKLNNDEMEKLSFIFKKLPKFKIFYYDKFADIQDIKDSNLLEILNQDNTVLGRYIFYNNENLIFIFRNRNSIFHEITHCIYNKCLRKYNFSSSAYYLIDEYLAEYMSTIIMKNSMLIDEMILCIKSNRRIKPSRLPYYYGAISACIDLNIPIDVRLNSYLSKAQEIRESIKFIKNYEEIVLNKEKIENISHNII